MKTKANDVKAENKIVFLKSRQLLLMKIKSYKNDFNVKSLSSIKCLD